MQSQLMRAGTGCPTHNRRGRAHPAPFPVSRLMAISGRVTGSTGSTAGACGAPGTLPKKTRKRKKNYKKASLFAQWGSLVNAERSLHTSSFPPLLRTPCSRLKLKITRSWNQKMSRHGNSPSPHSLPASPRYPSHKPPTLTTSLDVEAMKPPS